jgi:hypothetical protein
LIWLVFGITATLLLVACGSPGAVQVATPTLEPTATPVPAEVLEIQAKLKDGPHGIGYDLSHGPNTYCSRCHSPENWDPAARVDPPPNCVSCKFPNEPEPRLAVSNPLIPVEEWKGISCEVCHVVRDNEVQAQIAWLDVQTGYHNTVASSTELCGKCHADTETLRHQRNLGEGAHADFTCTQCHEPHSVAAGCSTTDCHPALADPAFSHPGSEPEHAAVKCVACHDASGLEAGPLEEEAVWVVFRETQLLGRSSKSPYQSHTLDKQVDCARCHYPSNPWNLALVEETQ